MGNKIIQNKYVRKTLETIFLIPKKEQIQYPPPIDKVMKEEYFPTNKEEVKENVRKLGEQIQKQKEKVNTEEQHFEDFLKEYRENLKNQKIVNRETFKGSQAEWENYQTMLKARGFSNPTPELNYDDFYQYPANKSDSTIKNSEKTKNKIKKTIKQNQKDQIAGTSSNMFMESNENFELYSNKEIDTKDDNFWIDNATNLQHLRKYVLDQYNEQKISMPKQQRMYEEIVKDGRITSQDLLEDKTLTSEYFKFNHPKYIREPEPTQMDSSLPPQLELVKQLNKEQFQKINAHFSKYKSNVKKEQNQKLEKQKKHAEAMRKNAEKMQMLQKQKQQMQQNKQ